MVVKKESMRIVEYEEIGQVKFIRKSSVRNLKITIKPLRNVQVTVPYYISFEAAGDFVEEKRQWIKRSQARFSRFKNTYTIFDNNTIFKTRDHVLLLRHHEKSTIQTIIRNGQILIFFPKFAVVDDHRIQRAIRKAIIVTWRMETQKYLPQVIQVLASKYHFQYNRVSFRNNKTRWGSCSRDNNINLNIHLMRLPQHLVEYVVLHELCHTVQKNHQRTFWDLLDKITDGKSRILDKELNGYSPQIW